MHRDYKKQQLKLVDLNRLSNLENQLDQVLVENVEFRNIIQILNQTVIELDRKISILKPLQSYGSEWNKQQEITHQNQYNKLHDTGKKTSPLLIPNYY